MGDSTPSTTAVVSPNQARALKNSFLWNFKFHLREVFTDLAWPEPKDGKEAWKEFYTDFSAHLTETVGREAVSRCLDYCIKQKKRGNVNKALAKLGLAEEVQSTPAPQAATDARAIAASRFAAGEIDVTTFTEIVAALNAADIGGGDNIPPEAAKETAEEAPVVPVVLSVVEDEEDDLPF